MVTYVGVKMANDIHLVRRVERRARGVIRATDLDTRRDLVNHSPAGMAWTEDAGAAQLALAILADHTGDDGLAVRLHQAFKTRVVTGLPKVTWELRAEEVELVVRELRDAR